jgi:putative acetyltransferase
MPSTAAISIRSAKPGDLELLQTLFVNTIRTVCKKDYSPQEIKAWTASVENTKRWEHKLRTEHFIIAEQQESILGYCALPEGAYLDFLYVHHLHLGKGVGRLLYEEAERIALASGSTTLSSDVSITARPFFEKMGFSVLHQNENSVRGEVLINYRMEKPLRPPVS